jgi:hypothetical protein
MIFKRSKCSLRTLQLTTLLLWLHILLILYFQLVSWQHCYIAAAKISRIFSYVWSGVVYCGVLLTHLGTFEIVSFIVISESRRLQFGYLDVTALRRGVGEIFAVVGRAPACSQAWRGMQYRRSQKEIISYLIVLHSVGGLVSKVFTHPMWSLKCRIADYYAHYTTVH